MTDRRNGEGTAATGRLNFKGLLWLVVGIPIAISAVWIRGIESLSENVTAPLAFVVFLVGAGLVLIGIFMNPISPITSWRARIRDFAMIIATAMCVVGLGFLGISFQRMLGPGEVEGPLVLGLILVIPGLILLLFWLIGQAQRTERT